MTPSQRHVHSLPVPDEASINRLYPRMDLADAYAVRLPCNAVKDPELLARFMFDRPPRWVATLMGVRDAIMAGFGIKTARGLRSASGAAADRRVSIFKIYSKKPDEIVMGEDDRHLDFRISVLLQTRAIGQDQASYVVVSTVVHCHNRLGHVYLKVISPFHRLIVRSMLRRASRNGWPLATVPIDTV